MATYLLYESASGYGLFFAHGLDKIGDNPEAISEYVSDLYRFGEVVQFVDFLPFESDDKALYHYDSVSDGVLSHELKDFLETNLPEVTKGEKANFSLGLAEIKLGSQIIAQTGIPCESTYFILELLRGVRLHFDKFIEHLEPGDIEKSQVGLGHSSYSRDKFKKSDEDMEAVDASSKKSSKKKKKKKSKAEDQEKQIGDAVEKKKKKKERKLDEQDDAEESKKKKKKSKAEDQEKQIGDAVEKKKKKKEKRKLDDQDDAEESKKKKKKSKG